MRPLVALNRQEDPYDALDPYIILEAASDMVAWLVESMPDELREQVEEWLRKCED